MTMKFKAMHAKYCEGDCIFDLITSMEIVFIGALLYLGRYQCFLFSYPSRKRGDVIINVGRSSPKCLLVSSYFKYSCMWSIDLSKNPPRDKPLSRDVSVDACALYGMQVPFSGTW